MIGGIASWSHAIKKSFVYIFIPFLNCVCQDLSKLLLIAKTI